MIFLISFFKPEFLKKERLSIHLDKNEKFYFSENMSFWIRLLIDVTFWCSLWILLVVFTFPYMLEPITFSEGIGTIENPKIIYSYGDPVFLIYWSIFSFFAPVILIQSIIDKFYRKI